METKATLEQRLVTICQTVRNEALEPALKEAEELKRSAEKEKERIIAEAHRQAREKIQEAEARATEIRRSLEASLKQASLQSVELVKEQIEKALFNPAIDSYVSSSFKSNTENAHLIKALILALEKEGIFGSIDCELGKALSKEAIAQELGKDILDRLKNKEIRVGSHNWGVIVKIEDKHILIDISEHAVKELLSSFLRPEFRKMLFSREDL